MFKLTSLSGGLATETWPFSLIEKSLLDTPDKVNDTGFADWTKNIATVEPTKVR